ncbi:hypothetical protein CDAR_430731 [Caerostris darwini]|uniref:Uncharacterized protein n=1 Tax=Caerostris darwini TaxID=1538125 RepID=A0AAV4Q4D2_9ARAC|nr:hypothetical protein CDAR_430731 [Caerostris darwini]
MLHLKQQRVIRGTHTVRLPFPNCLESALLFPIFSIPPRSGVSHNTFVYIRFVYVSRKFKILRNLKFVLLIFWKEVGHIKEPCLEDLITILTFLSTS